MIGQNFGRLIVIGGAGRDKKRNILWRCICDCGTGTVAAGYRLRKGETRSCGCLQRETTVERNTRHGLCGSRLYSIWSNMLSRCGNDKNPQFSDYGGRGISVCEEWHDFTKFADWALANGYSDCLTIDRVINDDGYSPRNCRWATAFQQSRNKRPRRDQKLTDAHVEAIRNDPRPQSAIAATYSIHQQHVSRIKRGLSRAFPTGEQHHA